ncbi:ferritin-like domain-containing protein [Clostridium sp. MB40-C1]|uniref:ferritin-like domain-containing protein n=1 Tax=Clostridium sp. MB40-C1 TaxID=3070996 RepID=UPI0027DEAF91|nr:ferritin-like domain-containing protein [Clostridium sp. MB40-C1]WMJ79952.1 ferritin-like domain-containing protein [Clostridium sp. MB40-C1]
MYQPMPCGMMYNTDALQKSLKLIKEAVSGEREDELFYDYLISVAPTRNEKEIIVSIRDDERKHNKMFRMIYRDLTGMDIEADENIDFEKPVSYLDGIKRALFGELKAVEKYRIIRQGLPTRYYRDMLFEIITDEIKHACKYNYLFTLNKDMKMTRCSNDEDNKGNKDEDDKDNIMSYVVPVVSQIFEDIDISGLERAAKDFKVSSLLISLKNLLGDAANKVEDWEKSEELKFFKNK